MATASKLVLLAHGSRDERWRQPFEALARQAGPEVLLAYMDMCSPTLMDVAEQAYANGCRHLVVLPLFLSGGGHVNGDIPKLAQDVMKRFTDMTIDVRPAVGEHPKVIQAFLDVIRETRPVAAMKTGEAD